MTHDFSVLQLRVWSRQARRMDECANLKSYVLHYVTHHLWKLHLLDPSRVLSLPLPPRISNLLHNRLLELNKWTKKHSRLFGREFAEFLACNCVWSCNNAAVLDNQSTAVAILKKDDLGAFAKFKLAAHYWLTDNIRDAWNLMTDAEKTQCTLGSTHIAIYWAYRIIVADNQGQLRPEISVLAFYEAAEGNVSEPLYHLWTYELSDSNQKNFSAVRAFEIAAHEGSMDVVFSIWSMLPQEETRRSLIQGALGLSMFSAATKVFEGSCAENYEEIARFVLELSTLWQKVDILRSDNFVAFRSSVEKGHWAIVKLLLDNSSKVVLRGEERAFCDSMIMANHCQAFVSAVRLQQWQMVELLWKYASNTLQQQLRSLDVAEQCPPHLIQTAEINEKFRDYYRE